VHSLAPCGNCQPVGYYRPRGTKVPLTHVYATDATLKIGVSSVRAVLPEELQLRCREWVSRPTAATRNNNNSRPRTQHATSLNRDKCSWCATGIVVVGPTGCLPRIRSRFAAARVVTLALEGSRVRSRRPPAIPRITESSDGRTLATAQGGLVGRVGAIGCRLPAASAQR
jgi:hypothetical protein